MYQVSRIDFLVPVLLGTFGLCRFLKRCSMDVMLLHFEIIKAITAITSELHQKRPLFYGHDNLYITLLQEVPEI